MICLRERFLGTEGGVRRTREKGGRTAKGRKGKRREGISCFWSKTKIFVLLVLSPEKQSPLFHMGRRQQQQFNNQPKKKFSHLFILIIHLQEMSRLLWLWERSRLVYEFPRELLMPLTLPDIGFRVVCPAAARWLLWERSEVQRLSRERKWMPHSTASGRRIAQVGQYCFFGTALHLSQARWLSLLAHLLKPQLSFPEAILSYLLLVAPESNERLIFLSPER